MDEILKFNEARFLEQKEVTDLVNKCYDFGCWFPQNFVGESIPPKLHMVVCAIPVCVTKWKTLGLLSEHGLESLHAAINGDKIVYCRVGNKSERLKLIFEHHGQRSRTNKDAIKGVPRRCESPTCGKSRYKKMDGVRKCPKCEWLVSK